MQAKRTIPGVVLSLAAVLLAAGEARRGAARAPRRARRAAAETPEAAPASQPADDNAAEGELSNVSRYGKLYRILKFTPAKPEQIKAFEKRAFEWARQTRKTINKDLRLVETTHFLIFTTWARRDHRALGVRCEAMYRALCRQFDIPATRNVWAGKCPIFMFWEKKEFDAFTTKIDKIGATQAAGYNVQKGDGFTYIVLSHTRTKTWFYEVLIHESTHAFLGRYLTNRIIPRWANEGLAEYMAAKLVKGSQAERKYELATRLAVANNLKIEGVFSGKHLTPLGYGIVQSLVRYLAAGRRKEFLRFIRLMKEGKSEKEALKEGLNMTHAELAEKWRQWARRQVVQRPVRRRIRRPVRPRR